MIPIVELSRGCDGDGALSRAGFRCAAPDTASAAPNAKRSA
jgi:hypothetical protein